MKVLEVKGVKKKLGKREIIKGLDLSVNEGEIFGFLGPNGAGKTTTIRMLVGLISPNEGEIVVCGKSVLSEKEQALKNVSGRENLMQIARIRKVSKEEVEELIDLVGLKDRIDDKVRKYSLGMKQRLGLAAALIGNPKLLILDEPTNGLDPSGIIDFRDVVKKAARERGMAVFISSHILSEVQNLCDRVAFINNGVIKSVEDIHDNSMETELDSLTLVVSSNKEQAIKVLKDIGFVNSSTVIDEEIHIIVETGKTTELLKIMLFTLIKNELIKISKRAKTWIVFALFAICVVGIGVISNIDAKQIAYNNTPEGRIESLNSSIQYAEDHLKELETYKDKWAEEAIEEQKQYIISLKEEIKLQEERKKNPNDPNLWRKTLEQEKKNIQEVLDDESYPDRYKTYEKQRMAEINSFLDAGIKPVEEWEFYPTNVGMQFMQVVGLIILAAGIAVFMSDIVSGESTPATLKFLLVL